MYDSTSIWAQRIKNANRYYEEWSNKFKCAKLEEYYEGFQWRNRTDQYDPYTLNMIGSTIEIKLASLLFQRPLFTISPKPGNSNWDQEFAIKSAQLKQDVLNAIVSNPNSKFANNYRLAALDSFFRFGIIEIGYAVDWRNPLKTQPLTKSWEDEDINVGDDRDRVIEDNPVPVSESFYFKRIKAKRFRVSASDSEELVNCDWCGYYEYFYKSFLENSKNIKLPANYQASDYSRDTLYDSESAANNQELINLARAGAVCKVWHIWDNVSSKRLLLLDGYMDEPLWQEHFDELPFTELRWKYRLDGWYPIPPTFTWISSQNEINESREQMRSYRRRFTRKFQALQGSIDEEEKEKFASGPDGIIIEVKQRDAITAISNPEVGPNLPELFTIAKDDMNIVSGTSSEARGQADRTTATQAKLIDARSTIRESFQQVEFSNFVCAGARKILVTARDKMVMGLWVKYSSDPSEQFLGEVQANAPVYKFVTSQQIDDGYDFQIEIDVSSLTPAAMQDEKAKFIEFLSLVNQFPQLSLSPILIREAAYRVGYRNEKVIQQMQQAALLQMMGQAQQAQQAQNPGNAGNNIAKGQIAQNSPNTGEQIQNQLENQVLQ